jgi:antirestriction protein ArdC
MRYFDLTEKPAKRDVYQAVTDKIIAALESGTAAWFKPWQADHPAGSITRPLRACGTPYTGMNVILLWAEAVERGYSAPYWMTYRQAKELGGQVRAGETSTLVIFFKILNKVKRDENGNDKVEKIPLLRGYNVFNIEQIDGLPEKFTAPPKNPLSPAARIERAEAFAAATKATIKHGGSVACYREWDDTVRMPEFEAFHDAEAYYGTLMHELVHWTKIEARCNRDFGRKRWGDEGYAIEELVAELGAAFLCADLGLAAEPRPDHASYVANWLKVLKDDKTAIVTAAGHAQRAVTYLHGLHAVEASPEEENILEAA